MTIQNYEDRRKREKEAELAANYREIGCAAVLAALVYAQNRRDAQEVVAASNAA